MGAELCSPTSHETGHILSTCTTDPHDDTSTFTVPSDCDCVALLVSSYCSSAADMINGADWDDDGTPQAFTSANFETSPAPNCGSIWYLNNPTTGQKTLNIDWVNGNLPLEACQVTLVYMKGVASTGTIVSTDQANRDSAGDVTASMTGVNGRDLALAVIYDFDTAANALSAGTFLTSGSHAGSGTCATDDNVYGAAYDDTGSPFVITYPVDIEGLIAGAVFKGQSIDVALTGVEATSAVGSVTVPGATAEPGDYHKRTNGSNTDTYPTAGSDLLLLWPTAGDVVGSGITYSAGTFTLGSLGRYLVLASDQCGTTSTTNNERINAKMTLNLAGTELVEGYSTGYIRKSSGNQEMINFSAAVIEVTSLAGSNNDLQVRVERIDNSTTGSPARITDRSGITIIKLDDDWDYGRYRSSAVFATSATDNAATVANLQTEVEEDATFTRTTNTIDIATGDFVLAVYSVKSEDTAPTGRAEYQSRLTLGGAVVPGSYGQNYIRVTDNCDWGGNSVMCLLDPTSGDDVELEVVSRESGGEDFEAALQLVKLPASAKAIIVEATTGNVNTAATNFAWDTNPHIDTDVFTHTLGNANLDVDADGDYLVMASQCDDTAAGGGTIQRATPALQFRVNTTDDESTGNACYHRGNGTADHFAMACATLLTDLTANDSIYARNDRVGTVTTALTNSNGGMAVLQLSSLFPTGAGATLTGVAGTSAVGSVDKTLDVDASGVQAASDVGTPGVSVTVALTGVLAVAAVGSVGFTEAGSVGATGVEATTAVGTLSSSRTVALSGVQADSEVGSVTPSLSVTVPLTGVQADSAVGSVSFTKSGSVALTGVQATPGLGSVGFTESGQVGITGVEAVAAVGSVGVSIGGSVALTGVQADTGVGSLDKTIEAALSGVASIGAVGSLDNETDIDMSGVQAASGTGTLTASSASGATLSGVEGVSAVESPGVSITVTLTGVGSVGSVGSVGANTTITLNGVDVTALVGSVGASGPPVVTQDKLADPGPSRRSRDPHPAWRQMQARLEREYKTPKPEADLVEGVEIDDRGNYLVQRFNDRDRGDYLQEIFRYRDQVSSDIDAIEQQIELFRIDQQSGSIANLEDDIASANAYLELAIERRRRLAMLVAAIRAAIHFYY